VIARRDDGEHHGRRPDERRPAQQPATCRTEHDDADKHVPAGVEARQSGVLVDERRRDELPIPLGVRGDRVDDRQVGQSRWCHGVEREDEQADQSAQQAGVAQLVVAAPAVAKEQHAGDDDHGPVPVHVDGVRRIEQQPAADDVGLQRALPRDAEALLEPDHSERVPHRHIRRAFGERSHAEVDEVGEREDPELA
jgi:hypothetical protein